MGNLRMFSFRKLTTFLVVAFAASITPLNTRRRWANRKPEGFFCPKLKLAQVLKWKTYIGFHLGRKQHFW